MKNNGPVTDFEHKFPSDPNAKIISVTDREGIITEVNDTFVQMSGFSREELIGQPQNIVRHPDMPALIFADLWKTIKSGHPFMGIIKNRCKDGSYYWVNAMIMPIIQNGEIVGYESVRTAASETQIARAKHYYKMINEGKVPTSLRFEIPYWCFYVFFALAYILTIVIHDQYVTTASFVVLFGLLIYGSYRRRSILDFITRVFPAEPNVINTLVYTNRAGKESERVYNVMYKLKEIDTILTRVRSSAMYINQVAQDRLEDQSNSLSEAQRRSRFTTDLMNEMKDIGQNISHMVFDISSLARETANNTTAARDLVGSGKEVAFATKDAINDLQEVSDQIRCLINNLAAHVDDIEKASSLIKGIASQTNLLALNASIEAARAGEAGRGFAVVADEVRSLSLRTESTTVQIHDLINEFKVIAGKTVAMVESGHEHVNNGVEHVALTNQKLDEILDAISNIQRLASEVATRTQEQSSTAQEVNIKVQHILSITEDNLNSSEESFDGSHMISSYTSDLTSMVDRFSNRHN